VAVAPQPIDIVPVEGDHERRGRPGIDGQCPAVVLVGLQHRVVQGPARPVREGGLLQAVPQLEPFRAITVPLACQLGGGHALRDAAQDQDQLGGPPLRTLQARTGDGVEDMPAAGAPVVEDRGAMAAVDVQAVACPAARAGQAVGVQPGEELGVAGILVHQLGEREVHGRLRCGPGRMELPSLRLIARE
jgi:hypothetical protein